MSADNGIYILKTPNDTPGFEHEFEWRVVHAQAIESIYYENEEGNPEYVVTIFGEAPVFTDREEAIKLANKIEAHMLMDDFCPVVEYGICVIELPHPFSYYLANYFATNTNEE